MSGSELPQPADDLGLTVIVPARNESGAIGVTLDALCVYRDAQPFDVEIIVVNDGSEDDTGTIAAGYEGVTVLTHPFGAGYGRALKSGVTTATHEYIAICDADGTYPIESLPKLYELAQTSDMVVGARTGPHYWKSFLRSPLRSLFLFLTMAVTGSLIPDPNSGFRIFRKSQILPLLPELPKGFSFTTTSTLILTLRGYFVRFEPISYRPRVGRSKVRIVQDSLRVMQTLLEVTLRHNPIKAYLLVLIPHALVSLVVLAFVPSTVRWLWLGIAWAAAMLFFGLGMLAAARRIRR